MIYGLIHSAALLVFLILIYALLYENTLQRSEHKVLEQLSALYLQFTPQQILRVVHTPPQHIAYSQEMRLTVGNHAAIRRDADFAIRESIQCINSTVARRARYKMHDYISVLSSIIVHTTYFYLPFFLRFYNRVDKSTCRLAIRDVGYLKSLIVNLLYFRTHPHRASTTAIIIFRHIYVSARREIRIQSKILTTEISYRRIKNLIEIMRKNLRRQSDGNTFRPLGKQQREFHRQCQRFRLTTVVRHSPIRSLRIKYRLQREFRQPRLYITRSSRTVTSKDITPVTLAFDEQILLSKLHKRISDGSISMRMILHRVAHYIRDFIETPVIELLHRMKYPSLHRLQAILNMRHGTLKNNI